MLFVYLIVGMFYHSTSHHNNMLNKYISLNHALNMINFQDVPVVFEDAYILPSVLPRYRDP